MAWLVSALGTLLAAGGGYYLWNGSGYIRLDWGQAETVAGMVALSGGVVTVAVAALLFALRDLARRPAPAVAGPSVPPAADPRPFAAAALRPSLPTAPDPAPEAAAPLSAPEPVAEAPTVVGRYEANGASYVLFSDGTIEVETEHGTHRFESMAALRDHIDGQGAG